MTDYTVQIDLPDHKRGDRWPGITAIGPVIINGSQPAATLIRVKMHLRHTSGAIYKLDSDAGQSPDAPIDIDDPTTWQASIPEVEAFLAVAGKWAWDMEFFQTGKTNPLTLYKGDLIVVSDITK